jgi:hypothetical protein
VGVDLQSEHQRYLTEKYAKKPVIVVNYPKGIKAFYMRVNDDGRTVAAMDVLAPGIDEIIGGRVRGAIPFPRTREALGIDACYFRCRWALDQLLPSGRRKDVDRRDGI